MNDMTVGSAACDSSIALLDRSYRYFEQLRDDALIWDLDFRQMGAGEEGHRLVQVAGPDFGFVYCTFRSPYDQRSVSPVGLRTFSILAENRAPSTWCGQVFDWNTLVSMPVGDEFRALSSGYFSNYVFSLPEALLEATAEIQFESEWLDLAPASRGAVYELAAADVTRLRLVLRDMADEISVRGNLLNHPALSAKIASLVVGGLMNARFQPLRRAQRNRKHYFLAAQDFIDAHLEGPVLMKDICQAVGVSERTLEYAFREHQYISPKAYLNQQRLARVRQVLVEHAPGEMTVAGAANHLGFWHMGQFAGDYRKLYGENPTDTLARRF